MIQNPVMNVPMTRTDNTDRSTAADLFCLYLTEEAAQWSFAHNEMTAEARERAIAVKPNHMNESQVNIYVSRHLLQSVCPVLPETEAELRAEEV